MITGRTIDGINDPGVRRRLYVIVILLPDYAVVREFFLDARADETLDFQIGIRNDSTIGLCFCLDGGRFPRRNDIRSIFGYGACKRVKFVEC